MVTFGKNENALTKSSNELFEFFTELGKALEDNKITGREGIKLFFEGRDFIETLKNRKEIVSAIEAMDEMEKKELIVEYFRKINVQFSDERIKLYFDLLNTIVLILHEFNDAFDIVKEIKLLNQNKK